MVQRGVGGEFPGQSRVYFNRTHNACGAIIPYLTAWLCRFFGGLQIDIVYL